MKKIVITAALAMAAFAGANAATTANTTLRVTVPQILSITANPTIQTIAMDETTLGTESSVYDVTYTVISNDAYSASSTLSLTLTPTNTSTAALKSASMTKFASAMQIGVDGGVLGGFNAISGLSMGTPTTFGSNGLQASFATAFGSPLATAHTSSAGSEYKLSAKVVGGGMDLIPGVYRLTINTTVTQP